MNIFEMYMVGKPKHSKLLACLSYLYNNRGADIYANLDFWNPKFWVS